MMVVGYTIRRRHNDNVEEVPCERRYRLNSGREVGSSEWGGTSISPTCQRAKKEK